MQDFPLHSVYNSRNVDNKKEIIEMTTMKIWRLAFAMLTAFSLVSCSSDDDDKDITKEIIMNVSAEPGVMYDLFDSMGEHPI